MLILESDFGHVSNATSCQVVGVDAVFGFSIADIRVAWAKTNPRR